MKNITKIKSVYKTIVNTLLKTEDVLVYWEYTKALNDFVELFPEIDFKTLNEDIRKELFEGNNFINSNNEIEGYIYGSPLKKHKELPAQDEEIVIVYKNGTTVEYDYINGNLMKRGEKYNGG